MTTLQILACYGMFLGGQLLQLFWVKIPALQKQFAATNKPFSMSQYFKTEWNFILGAQIACGLLLLGWDQLVLNWKPEWGPFSKWVFLALGGWGTSIAQSRWGKTDAMINKLIDVKANVSDAVTGGTTTVHETIEKGTAATGQEIKPTI